ncbi:hypothetical protein [Alphabaculovirus altersperidaniae]|uniref:Uncharacterized protein n=1 Tax=Spodoptera eridania nucleopolyhedrovirus TaxID=2315721 RepID=A0ABX6TRX4_9ABAC|nr:hypothetical protein QKS47_gp041 [Spodoptera eridania nucleopolyhedrovirus]QNV47864.1 hypothetical protein [Spodoptera eridania nucleopolyhedrovirus]
MMMMIMMWRITGATGLHNYVSIANAAVYEYSTLLYALCVSLDNNNSRSYIPRKLLLSD